jgi:outer membrane protein OmpA-like peptidoglycan-associated protein
MPMQKFFTVGKSRHWDIKIPGFLLLWVFVLTPGMTYLSAQSPIVVSEDSVLFEKYSFLILFKTDFDHTRDFPEHHIPKLKEILESDKELSVRLEARTDSVGDYNYNINLATRRMNFARAQLIKRGIESGRFVENVYGEDFPLESNRSAEGRQANRSVKVAAGYQRPYQMVSGRMLSSENEKGIEGMLIAGSRYHRDTLYTDSTGSFKFPSPANAVFSIEFYSGDHILERTFYNLKREDPDLGSVKIEMLEPDAIFNFEDILFVPNQPVLLPGFQDALPRLLNTVRFASGYRFEIQGHVNFPFNPPQPPGTFYYNLSERRAKKVYSFLVENGIDSTRLEWNAYSNHKMIYPRARKEEEMKYNRRVAIKVLGKVEDELAH